MAGRLASRVGDHHLPNLPWFEDGELETLVLADRAEWDQLEASLR